MKTTHTPGPWGIETTSDTMYVGRLRSGSHKVDHIACKCDGGSSDGYKDKVHAEKVANAILIAAAPVLLGTLHGCELELTNALDIFEMGEASEVEQIEWASAMKTTLANIKAAIAKATA